MSESTDLVVPAFRVGDAIAYGWRRTWRNFWWFALVVIVLWIINGIASALSFSDRFANVDLTSMTSEQAMEALSANSYGAMTFVGSFVQFLVSIFLGLGLVRIALGVTSGDRVRLGRLFSFEGFGRYLVNSIVVGLLAAVGFGVPFGLGLWLTSVTDASLWVVIGALIGVVLAILLTLGLSLFGYAIIDKNAGGFSSLRVSWELVRPHLGQLFGLQILVALISFGIMIAAFVLGLLMLVVGLLVTLPVAGVIVFGLGTLSVAYAYRTFSGEPVA